MKTKAFIAVLAGLAGLICLSLFWKMRQPEPKSNQAVPSPKNQLPGAPSTAKTESLLVKNPYGRFAHMTVDELMKNRPKLHKIRGYPPTTSEGVEMWQWWNAISKADPNFNLLRKLGLKESQIDALNTLICGRSLNSHSFTLASWASGIS